MSPTAQASNRARTAMQIIFAPRKYLQTRDFSQLSHLPRGSTARIMLARIAMSRRDGPFLTIVGLFWLAPEPNLSS